ncbi:hypothetical protein NTE19_004138 [Vibrio fluvialis]|nr:hypothetical protein [Vibrio fluvialis]
MKTLTKTILGLGLTAFACGSFASSDKWERGSVESSFSSLIRLGLFKNGVGQLNVGITLPTDNCLTFNQDVIKAPSYKINGVSVKMYAQCVGKGLRMDFPATDKGKDYVISELRTKQSVTYEQEGAEVTFSAVGFIEAMKKVDKSDEGI